MITGLPEDEPGKIPDQKVGRIVDYAVDTDIITYINGQPIESYNINGYMAVTAEDLINDGLLSLL